MTDVQTSTEPELRVAAVAEPEPVRPGGAASTRRLVLLGAGAVGTTAVLAACGTSTNSASDIGSGFSTQPAPAGSAGADADGSTAGPGGTAGPGAGNSGATALAKTAAVKVGSGVITSAYVITQPEAGTYKCFSNVCPHAGCNVNKIDAGVIQCPCHGSQFSIKDGSVTTGPATTGLTEKAIKVDGANIVAA
jgi:Rieske Fe-S protein